MEFRILFVLGPRDHVFGNAFRCRFALFLVLSAIFPNWITLVFELWPWSDVTPPCVFWLLLRNLKRHANQNRRKVLTTSAARPDAGMGNCSPHKTKLWCSVACVMLTRAGSFAIDYVHFAFPLNLRITCSAQAALGAEKLNHPAAG